MALGGIVARPPRQHGDAVLLREALRDLRGALGRGAGVRRKIFVQKKNVHGRVRKEKENSANRIDCRITQRIASAPDQRGTSARRQACASSMSPSTSTSIFVRRKQSMASSGRHTMGSLSLNEVFSTTGTPVRFAKLADQPPIARVRLLRDGLQPAGAVHVRGRGNRVALFGTHGIGLRHERATDRTSRNILLWLRREPTERTAGTFRGA